MNIPSQFRITAEQVRASMPRNPVAENAIGSRASAVHKQLIKYILTFDQQLDQTHEVGVRLVSFGEAIVFHVRRISYSDPSLVTFEGTLDDGAPVQLVQHISQLSFLLTAVKRADPNQPKRPFGFNQA
jgi:hypothetical protein